VKLLKEYIYEKPINYFGGGETGYQFFFLLLLLMLPKIYIFIIFVHTCSLRCAKIIRINLVTL
jgi:hypothetical protein